MWNLMQEIGISLYEIFDCLVLFFYLFQEREREREREKCFEAEKMKTLKRLRAFFWGVYGLNLLEYEACGPWNLFLSYFHFETRIFTGPKICKNCPLTPPFIKGPYLRTPRLVVELINWISFYVCSYSWIWLIFLNLQLVAFKWASFTTSSY